MRSTSDCSASGGGAALRELYANARLFVLASHHEGLPICALEAMSAGAPVLLSNIGPNRDVGLPDYSYFPVGDVSALADRLSETPVAFQQSYYDEVLRKFAWDDITLHTLAIYDDLKPRRGVDIIGDVETEPRRAA